MKKKHELNKMSKDTDEICAIIFRKISEPLSNFLIKHTNVTPNSVTIFSFFCVLIAGAFFILGSYQNQIIGLVFTTIYAILDHVDGNIARVKNLGSKLGKWLDGIVGFVSIPFLIFCLAYGIGTQYSMVIGSLAMISYPLHYAMIRYYKLDIMKMNEPLRISSSGRFESYRKLYGSMLFFMLLIVFILINKPIWLLLFYAIVGNLVWIFTLYLQYKGIKQIENKRGFDEL